MSKQIEKPNESDLDWVQLHKDMLDSSGQPQAEETWSERIIRKFLKHPLVPIGMLATSCALGYGLLSMKRGDKKMSQKMMRARVLAQGFTISVAVGSLIIAASRAKFEKPQETSEKSQEPNEVKKAT